MPAPSRSSLVGTDPGKPRRKSSAQRPCHKPVSLEKDARPGLRIRQTLKKAGSKQAFIVLRTPRLQAAANRVDVGAGLGEVRRAARSAPRSRRPPRRGSEPPAAARARSRRCGCRRHLRVDRDGDPMSGRLAEHISRLIEAAYARRRAERGPGAAAPSPVCRRSGRYRIDAAPRRAGDEAGAPQWSHQLQASTAAAQPRRVVVGACDDAVAVAGGCRGRGAHRRPARVGARVVAGDRPVTVLVAVVSRRDARKVRLTFLIWPA